MVIGQFRSLVDSHTSTMQNTLTIEVQLGLAYGTLGPLAPIIRPMSAARFMVEETAAAEREAADLFPSFLRRNTRNSAFQVSCGLAP